MSIRDQKIQSLSTVWAPLLDSGMTKGPTHEGNECNVSHAFPSRARTGGYKQETTVEIKFTPENTLY
jgi:hypothetical protein